MKHIIKANVGQTRRTQEKCLRHVPLGEGLPPIASMRSELQDMTDVLLGRVDPPVSKGVLTLFEVADAYFGRGMEMTRLIQAAELVGSVARGSAHVKFRTGELRTFVEMAKRAADLGSRRVTAEQLRVEAERSGRGDSW